MNTFEFQRSDQLAFEPYFLQNEIIPTIRNSVKDFQGFNPYLFPFDLV